MNTALYRRRAANINSFKEKLQNYNGEIVILFVDEKMSCALDHKTP